MLYLDKMKSLTLDKQAVHWAHWAHWAHSFMRFVYICSECEESSEERGSGTARVLQFNCLFFHTCIQTVSQLTALLVGWSVEEDDRENIQIPHAEDPCEESTVDL